MLIFLLLLLSCKTTVSKQIKIEEQSSDFNLKNLKYANVLIQGSSEYRNAFANALREKGIVVVNELNKAGIVINIVLLLQSQTMKLKFFSIGRNNALLPISTLSVPSISSLSPRSLFKNVLDHILK